jgi:hypothetical protein
MLAGCAGGGGGGGDSDDASGGVVTGFEGPLTEISSPVTVAPRHANLRFDGVQTATESSGPSGPSDFLLLHIDPGNSTVGIERFARTREFLIDFDDDTQVFAFATAFEERPRDVNAKMLIPGAASGFLYTSYGIWDDSLTTCFLSTCGSSFFADAFFFGSPTRSSAMPRSGSATFNGTMDGYHSRFTQDVVALEGDATLVADFGAGSVNGSFHNIATRPILGPGVDTFNDIQISAAISGGALNGTVVGGAGGSGPIEGHFFGPAAEEVGGVFRMTGNGHTIGAFAARR